MPLCYAKNAVDVMRAILIEDSAESDEGGCLQRAKISIPEQGRGVEKVDDIGVGPAVSCTAK